MKKRVIRLLEELAFKIALCIERLEKEEEEVRGGLRRCPICGRFPKIKILYIPKKKGELTEGAYCDIYCRPFFKRKHYYGACVTGSYAEAVKEAVEFWNKSMTKVEDNSK